MPIKTETYTTEDGEERIIEYFGEDEDHIVGKCDRPAYMPEIIEEPATLSEAEVMALENYNNLNYLVDLAELGM
jgi:hypothetical protein